MRKGRGRARRASSWARGRWGAGPHGRVIGAGRVAGRARQERHGRMGAGHTGAGERGGGAASRGLGPGRAAWVRGLAKGCALGALGLFLARFDSVFFLSQIFGHCS